MRFAERFLDPQQYELYWKWRRRDTRLFFAAEELATDTSGQFPILRRIAKFAVDRLDAAEARYEKRIEAIAASESSQLVSKLREKTADFKLGVSGLIWNRPRNFTARQYERRIKR